MTRVGLPGRCLEPPQVGAVGITALAEADVPETASGALDRFDDIAQQGYVDTRRLGRVRSMCKRREEYVSDIAQPLSPGRERLRIEEVQRLKVDRRSEVGTSP